MNVCGGWALVKGLWASWLQYRSFFMLLAFGWMIPPLIYLLVWSTAAGERTIGGMNRGEFVGYYLALILVNQITYSQANWTVGDLIRSGGMNRVLLRPIPAIFDALASEVAGKVVYLVFDVPIVIVLALVLSPEMEITWQNGLLFLPALILAWALRFLWGYWLALLAHWATRADALLALQDSLVALLGGQIAPVALLPPILLSAAIALPFRYMAGFPVEVLTGRLETGSLLSGLAIQGACLSSYGGLGCGVIPRLEVEMSYLRLIANFLRVSFQEEAAYSANFAIGLFHSLLNLTTGVLAIVVFFNQVKAVHGWDLPATLALLGVYLTVSALRGLFISPGFDMLAGIDGEIWKGTFDYTIIRPVNTQFLVSLRKWRPLALLDLLFGLGILAEGLAQLRLALTIWRILAFLLAFGAGVLTLYAILLAFTALVFWSPGVLFTWLFDGFFQLARYPIGMYPGWMRLVLTWVIPVGIITTIPAQALTGSLPFLSLAGGLVFALLLSAGASLVFRAGLRRYSSASS